MPIIIDDSTVRDVLAAVGTIGTTVSIAVGYLFKKGYIDIWLTKIFTPSEEIHALKKQNGHALTKLNMSDDLVEYLQLLAPGEGGTIDEEKAIASLRDCIKWNNRIIRNIPDMKDLKKD